MRAPRHLTSVCAIAVVLMFVAGCGGGSSKTAAALSPTGVLAYSHCMHSHGVADFPAPDSSGAIPKDKIHALGDGPRFQVAEHACQHVMAASGLEPKDTAIQPTDTRLAAALAFARCVRYHGFPTFPDPTASGQLSPEMIRAAGIALHHHGLLRAGLACVPVTHHLITQADVKTSLRGG